MSVRRYPVLEAIDWLVWVSTVVQLELSVLTWIVHDWGSLWSDGGLDAILYLLINFADWKS